MAVRGKGHECSAGQGECSRLAGRGRRDWSPNQGGYNEDLPCLASSATWDMSADQITYFTLEIFTDARVLGQREKGKHEWT